MSRRSIVVLSLFVPLLLVSWVAGADEFGMTLDAWFGWTSPLDDYYLTGELEPLDLSGVLAGSTGRIELRFGPDPWLVSFVVAGGGSYALTGGTHDVMRMVDLFIGAKAGISLLPVFQPHVLAGLMYSHYILMVPHHESNSATLLLYGFRLGAGIDARFFTFDIGNFDLALELTPEYILDVMFSDAVILVQEFRVRATMRFIER